MPRRRNLRIAAAIHASLSSSIWLKDGKSIAMPSISSRPIDSHTSLSVGESPRPASAAGAVVFTVSSET